LRCFLKQQSSPNLPGYITRVPRSIIDVKKRFLRFFILVKFFNVFLFSKRFFYFKKTLAKFRAASKAAVVWKHLPGQMDKLQALGGI